MEHIENPRLVTLYEQYNDLIFEIALVKLQDQELKQFDVALSEGEEQAANAFFERTQEKTLSVINRQFNKRTIKHIMCRTLPRVGIAFASVMLIFFLSLATAIATVQPVREKVLKLIMEIEERYTTISLSEDNGISIDIPEDWKGEYFPSYLPEGYEFKGITDDMISVVFENTPSEFVWFTECIDTDSIRFDTENSIITDIVINDISAQMFEADGVVQIIWKEDDRLFKLRSTLNRFTAITVAEGVRRFK